MKKIINYLNSLEGNATNADFCMIKECVYFLLKVVIVFATVGGALFIYILNTI